MYRKDFVYIYDGNNITGAPLQTLTGLIGFGNSFLSTGRDMYIHFTSDNESSSNLGFTIQYEAGKLSCKSNDIIRLSGYTHSIFSLSIRIYNIFLVCKWRI